ncbi:hypothetical protein pipiens_016534 [Culex pipiens pipiens]|uniref:DNA-directed RNA polymerases I and III subunit RPAC1 n=1 Tax=Culex pipiens pipiens TaxID=38569 RepID=A0ABD1CM64_CULPP
MPEAMERLPEKPRIYLEEYKLKQDANDYGLADDFWDFERFKRQLQIVVVRYEENELEFDMIGVSPAIANAFRRLMLSEVPSMAIEKVHIYNNTSIIQDEVLAHRLGLIPLKADPRLFEYKTNEGDAANAQDTLEFELKVKCTKKNKNSTEVTNNDSMYKNHSIYSGQIKWVPVGNQASIYKEADVGPIDDDILICFSPGVIEIDKDDQAYVKDARYDSCSRNVYRYPQLADSVTMSRVRNHFIFNVESLGALKPDVIFVEAAKVLKKKCKMFLDEIKGN